MADQVEGCKGITYREDFGAWWPDYDHKPEKCHAFVQRGLKDMDVAIAQCKHHAVCIQAGGHVGFWPERLATKFRNVLTFEPEPMLFECMKRNLRHYPNVGCYNFALSDHEGIAKMRPSVSAGSWRVDDEGTALVAATTIDLMYRVHHIRSCDAIFLDVEGYEVQALRGGLQTIKAYHPVLHVEELPRAIGAIHSFMKAIGYRMLRQVGKDVVYVAA